MRAWSSPCAPSAPAPPRATRRRRNPPKPLRRDGHLQHAVGLAPEELVRPLDLLQPEPVRHHEAEVEAPGLDDIHEPPHALLAAGAQAGHDAVIAEARVEG